MTTVASLARSGIALGLTLTVLVGATAGSFAGSPSSIPTAASGSPGASLPVDAGAVLARDLLGPGRLTICTSFPRQRFAEYDADGRPFGVDVEIGQGLAAALGLESEVRDQVFENLLDAVVDGQCDVSIAGQFITSGRLERIDMIAYREGTPHVVVRAGDPLATGDLLDLCGRAFAVVAGTVHVEIVRGLGDFAARGVDDGCRHAGTAAVDLREYATQADAEDALARGDAAAYAGNDFITVDRPDVFALGPPLPPIRNGIGTRKEAAALHAALRAALGSMIDDGSYLAILERYDAAHVAVTSRP